MRNKLLRYIVQNQILVALFVVAIVWIVIQIREILITLFISYILMAAISPYVEFLEKRRVPKPVAIIVPYVITIAFIVIIIATLLPFFIGQIELLLSRFPSYIGEEAELLGLKLDQSSLGPLATAELKNLGTGVFSITSWVFGGVFSAISIFVISFYLLLYKKAVTQSFASCFPKSAQDRVYKTIREVEDKLGSWTRGQIVLSGFIGGLTWVALTVLGIEFALPLAIIAGLLEIVPTIGPIISAVPGMIVALNISLPMAAVVAASYFFIQLVEGQILVPRVMQKAVGLNPILIIIGIIVGGKLLGIAGALLAIPFISLLVVIYKNLE